MNKDKFLTELREYLSILEKQEQEDILEEYAQHIDMKMQKGLSEEDAIGDFGSVEQLAAEILETYHVNPEFRGQAKNAMTRAICSIRNAFRRLGRKCCAFGKWLWKPFGSRRTNRGEAPQGKGILKERTKEMGGHVGRFCRAVGRGIVALWKWCIAFCMFGLKFMWNAAWLLFALICAGMAMFTLMGAGAIVVFLVQGYPFIGLFMICLGGLLCLGAMAYGAFSLLVRKKKDGGDEQGVKSLKDEMTQEYGKEAAYEQTT